MIEVKNLHKKYENIIAVNGISFNVEQGRTFGLLGPNGAGKTTTIKLLCGIIKPNSGTVSLNGKTDPTLMDVRRSLGVVPQTLAIYEELSAEENLRFIGRMYGLDSKKLNSRIAECLEIAGLSKRKKEKVAKYSGGMKRRLNMVCSLLHEPPILLLDEPTVGVDPQSRNLIFDTIEEIKKQGRTIIYTTHYMEEAERLCETVAILDHGQILDIDNVSNLIKKHGGASYIEAEFEEKINDIEIIKTYMDNTEIQFENNTIRFKTNLPMESLAKLNQSGLRFHSIKVQNANLEDVFLNLTGRRLRD